MPQLQQDPLDLRRGGSRPPELSNVLILHRAVMPRSILVNAFGVDVVAFTQLMAARFGAHSWQKQYGRQALEARECTSL